MHEFGTLALLIEGIYHNPVEPADIKGALAPVPKMLKSLIEDIETLPGVSQYLR